MSSRVLVADDSSTMRKIVIRSLQAVGVTEVTEAADGTEAIAKFQPGQFDMVLTDWNMPGKSGLEVVQDIRGRDAKIPIIMVTTEAEKTRVVQAIQAGVSDYLVKPFTAETLREKLTKHGCNSNALRSSAGRGSCRAVRVIAVSAFHERLGRSLALPEPVFTQAYLFSTRNKNSRFGWSASRVHSLVHFMPAMTFCL